MLCPVPWHSSQKWLCSVWSRHWVSSALQYFSYFLYVFFPWLVFSDLRNIVGTCKLCSVGLWKKPSPSSCVGKSAQARAEPPRDLGQSCQHMATAVPSLGRAQCWQSCHVSGSIAGSWISALFCTASCRFSPLLHIYYKYLPWACFTFWLLVLPLFIH